MPFASAVEQCDPRPDILQSIDDIWQRPTFVSGWRKSAVPIRGAPPAAIHDRVEQLGSFGYPQRDPQIKNVQKSTRWNAIKI
jgi:hypothetical protein